MSNLCHDQLPLRNTQNTRKVHACLGAVLRLALYVVAVCAGGLLLTAFLYATRLYERSIVALDVFHVSTVFVWPIALELLFARPFKLLPGRTARGEILNLCLRCAAFVFAGNLVFRAYVFPVVYAYPPGERYELYETEVLFYSIIGLVQGVVPTAGRGLYWTAKRLKEWRRHSCLRKGDR